MVATLRPDLAPTGDVVRCGNASATTSQPGSPPLAAVDGSKATGWQPVTLPATLTVSLPGGAKVVSEAILQWGQHWPSPPEPSQPPPPGPVTTERATSYALEVSVDGRTWNTVATIRNRTGGTTDVLQFPATSARFVALHVIAGQDVQPPVLNELLVGS
jgi:hypothetical protein